VRYFIFALKDGSYVKSPNEKLEYGTLMYVRVVMLQSVTFELAKACTIAIRYSAVRRQSEMKPG
jgi:acyl-CoA oxidase